ncbi:MAG: type II toxin-antitoxin system PemK/MazF family toxin [Nanoarchaeota archaeon]|nr:type II toxin-antitoxin system PemK/MazF family toxin [Nanoarchaeota archaeon]
MNKYNQIASELLGVPLTSKINDFTLNYGLDITNDDIEGDFALDKQTFILCDRPCRISKSDLGTMKTDGSRISKELFTRIVDNISHFIRYGKRLGA